MAPNFHLYACTDAAPAELPVGVFGEPLRAVAVGDVFVVGGALASPSALRTGSDLLPRYGELMRALQAKLSAVMPIFYGTMMEEERVGRLDAAHLRRELERVRGLDLMQVDVRGSAKRAPKRPKKDAKKPPPEPPELAWIAQAAAPFAKGPGTVSLRFLEELLAAAPTWVRDDSQAKDKLEGVLAVVTHEIERGQHAAYRAALEAAAAEHGGRLEIHGPKVAYGAPFAPKPKA